ncbi:hypothetical protein ANN_03415 [Periplaneta americana]|uniref:Uncharacterized protein n=1 Tax=Periplaneta americana TaxID=6978 RepID=A0ABQ8TYX8_PERAM|nr:hypothetical protein ANN_03415 [Periplaneta americana]
MAGLCEGGIEPPGSLKASKRRELPTESNNLEDLGEIANCYEMTLAGEFQKQKQLPLGQFVEAKPKQKWVRMNERIRNIVLNYNQYKEDKRTLDYLTSICHNF